MGRIEYKTLPPELQANVNTLIPKINDLLERFGEFRGCNSGFRTLESHLNTYKDINAKRKKKGLPEIKVPMSSAHLSAEAIDLEDANGKLKAWILKNVKVLEELGLYCESFDYTSSWVHVQTRKPKSGSRFFIP